MMNIHLNQLPIDICKASGSDFFVLVCLEAKIVPNLANFGKKKFDVIVASYINAQKCYWKRKGNYGMNYAILSYFKRSNPK